MASKINITNEQTEKIIRLYRDDLLNLVEIGRIVGFSSPLVRRVLNENYVDTSRSYRRKLLCSKGKIKNWCKGLTKETDERVRNISELRKKCEHNFKEGNQYWKNRYDSGTNIEKVTLKCRHCNKKFKVINSRKEATFCSIKCYRKEIPSWNLGLSSETNETIKKSIEKRMKTIKKLKEEGRLIVSEQTRKKISLSNSGERNPMFGREHSEETRRKISSRQQGVEFNNWKNFISFFPYPPTFNNQFKKAIRKRDNHVCMKCFMKEEDSLKIFKRRLNVHHIDYIKENTFEQNCCALCQKCNAEVNFNRKHWTKFFQSLLAERYGYEYTPEGEAIINVGGIKNEV